MASLKDKDRYVADPSEFIDYINSASIVLTDSFHGSVFSILLEKPFFVFGRKGSVLTINSRIDTLLSTFGLESRKFDPQVKIVDPFTVDFSHIPSILAAERKKAIDYLKSALT